jgi:hypothetical protein
LHFCLSYFGWGRIRGMEWKAHFFSKLRFYLSRFQPKRKTCNSSEK